MSETAAVQAGTPGRSSHQLVIGPNASLSGLQASVFMLWMCLLSFGIAGLFARLGYWMVLPFAGLEMLALGGALWWALRENRYREVISIDRHSVRVQIGRRCPEHEWEFPRAWARLQREPQAGGAERIWLGYGGARCEIGACLGGEDRARLAQRLQQLLRARPVNEE